MKNTAKLLIILVQLIISNFQTFAIEKETEKNPEFQTKLLTIDFADSVIYDLSNAALVGNQYSFLVSIKSNDTINSLDFSFKYNQLKLQYDSISDLTNYIQAYSYFNSNDSTVRFTSNSFQNYSLSTPIVRVHFTVLSGAVDSSDIFTIKSYLNGSFCSSSLVPPISTGIQEKINVPNEVFIYPNPAVDGISLKGLMQGSNGWLEFYSSNGLLLVKTKLQSPISWISLDDPFFSNGTYTLRFIFEEGIFYRKLIVCK